MKVIFSDDLDIKINQEMAEDLNIHEAIKNIVNSGNPDSNESGRVEWETCEIFYKPLKETNFIGSDISEMLGLIKILDGDVLYESYSEKEKIKEKVPFNLSLASSMRGYNCRYTTQFRKGKWVERLLKYSEEISQKYQEEDRKKRQEAYAEKIKPFSEIDF
ncbi:hypothetical protein [Acinetobacter variabilis]|uniref:hypothetical protein n=1 Tax=Acinetobacter variabilis TaxID=70346 RepID=UPI0030F72CD3